MLAMSINEIVKCANKITQQCGTRDAHRIAEELDITILPRHFKVQRGAYKVILGNRFIFIKDDLSPVMENIVLLHEIGHDTLHRQEAVRVGGFQEFELFDMKDVRMEYEANILAAQIALPDDEVLEYIHQGYDNQKIACAMGTDINLVGLKVDILISQGYNLRRQEHCNDFLKHN